MFKRKIKFNSLNYFGRLQDDLRVIAKLRMNTDQIRRKKKPNNNTATVADDEFCVYDVFYEKPTVVSLNIIG